MGGPPPRTAVVLTCEHATDRAPAGSGLDPAVCASHVGWDDGALALAEALADRLGTDVLAGTWTRLWVDLNRSADNPGVVPRTTFGVRIPANEALDADQVAARLAADWQPFRDAAAQRVAAAIDEAGRCAHFSVHSFAPELDPDARTYPFGVLFDPARAAEAALADRILGALRAAGWDARANEPYLGVDDGHTTGLRRRFPDPAYAGLELELNQGALRSDRWPALRDAVVAAVSDAVADAVRSPRTRP